MTKRHRVLTIAALATVILLTPQRLFANVIWPAYVLEQRLVTWWIIGAGLLIEAVIIWRALGETDPTRAFRLSLGMNAASTILGLLLIPLAGLVWEIGPGLLVNAVFGGTFNPATWIATGLLAVFVNVVIEGFVFTKLNDVKFTRRLVGWLAVANGVTVGLALLTLWIEPPRY